MICFFYSLTNMIFLWLSIFCSTSIYVLFKIRKQLNISLTGIIIFNYLFASLLAYISSGFNIPFSYEWILMAFIIGFLFVLMFYLIGISTHVAGISVTTIATRMSMILPIVFSIFIFDESINLLKIVKITLALIAVLLAIYKPINTQLKTLVVLLPFILFLGSGSIDTLVKTAQHHYVPDNEIANFSAALFTTSFITSLLLLFIKEDKEKSPFHFKTIALGGLLGAFNFGSLFFFMKALNNSGMESSFVFGLNNLAIVVLSVSIAALIFKEQLSKINRVGIALSILSIILLSY